VNFDQLATLIITEDRIIKQRTKELENLKRDLIGMMQAENVGGIDVKQGKITLCQRTAKDYGDTIKQLEATLKAEKTRLDYLGQYTITNVTHYLRVG